MRSVLVEAGGAPARVGQRDSGRVLRFDARRTDRRGWRLAEIVAARRGIAMRKLFGRDRGEADVALARQIGMYLMHVCYGRHYAETGRFFGRDRTTVSHACALIEEMREDRLFDRELDEIEATLRTDAGIEREAIRASAR
jgi:hypothetical protein